MPASDYEAPRRGQRLDEAESPPLTDRGDRGERGDREEHQGERGSYGAASGSRPPGGQRYGYSREPVFRGLDSKPSGRERFGTAEQSDPSHRFDPDYHEWRAEQMRLLDRDYALWRQERYHKFAEEFDTWRRQRMSGQLDKSAAAEHRDRGDLSTRADRQDKSGGLLGGLLGSGSTTRK